MERYVFAGGKHAKWLRTRFIDNDGEVYVPCGAFVNETAVMASADLEGVRIVRNGRHAYVPASWLQRELRRYGRGVDVMARHTREAQWQWRRSPLSAWAVRR